MSIGHERPRTDDRVDCCFSKGRVLLLSLTSACNQRCVHCLRDAKVERPTTIDVRRLHAALINAAGNVNPERVVISGGEPTLLNELDDVISAVVAAGIRASLCTNAVKIDQDRAIRLAAAGLSSATVGIDGEAADHGWFRGTVTGHRQALRGIRALTGAGIAVTANVTLHDRILSRASGIGRDLEGLGLSSVSVTAPVVQGRLPRHRDAFGAVDTRSVVAFARVLRSTLDCRISIRVPRCDRASCPSGRRVFAMDAHGTVSDCPDIGSTNVIDTPLARLPMSAAR